VHPVGWEVDVTPTVAPGHGTELAREAVKHGVEVVFACGGDGTINEVVNGLAGTQTALAVLRGGMGNVFAKEIGVPRAHDAAIRVLVDGERRRFDLGWAGKRHFLLMAGIGFDAAVVRRVPAAHKRLLGSASYGLHAAIELAHYQPKPASLTLDGEAWQGDLFWALLGNTRSYGGIINVTAQARVDDGLLDAYIFAGRGVRWLTDTAQKLVRGRQDKAEGVIFRRLREASVETPGLAVQADGEYFGQTPMTFGVTPAALDVLLPKGKGLHLFSAG
jgi:YegS/Rv2252/BmrU family lipid kinase